MDMKAFTFLYLLLLSASALAQSKLRGKALDEKQQPLSFANVVLLNAKDSSLVNGSTTDSTGAFEFSASTIGAHILSVSLMGYQTLYQPVELINQPVLLLALALKPASQTLGEIQVTAKKPLIEMQGDKLIFNVASSPVAGGLNAFELLEKVPGVVVKKTDQTISLQGREGVLVMIDGRQTYLSPDQVANLLKTMRAEEIESIEVIANPSARYDAAGGSGILNIRTKRAKLYGTQYTAVVGGGYSYYPQYGNYPKYNTSLSISHRNEKFNLFGGLGFSRHSWISARTDQMSILESSRVVEGRKNNEFVEGFGYNANARAGLDYLLSKKTTVGLQVKGTRGRDEFNRFITQRIQRADSNQRMETIRYRDANSWNVTANANIKHTFRTITEGVAPAELTADLDYIRVKDTYLSLFDNRFYTESELSTPIRTRNRIDRPTSTRIVSIKSDYVRTLAANTKLEAGVKISFVNNNFEFNSDFIANEPRSEFDYTENINAVYMNWSGTFAKKTQYQLGLRGEQSVISGKDRSDREIVSYYYFNLFPTFSLNQKFDDQQQLTVSYSRRIDRPSYDRFNPFALFYNRLEYTQGNPLLLPGFRNVGTLTYSYKNAYTIGLLYQGLRRYPFGVYDVDSQLIPGERLIRTSYENLPGSGFVYYGVSASAQVSLVKGWNLTGNINSGVSQTRLRRNETIIDQRQLQAYLYASNNLTLSSTLTIEVAGWYQTGNLQGFERTMPQGAVNFGVLKTIWTKKANLKLALDDPFNLARYRFVATTARYRNVSVNRWDNRVVRLTFTYNFGNLNVKSGSERRSAEEVNRLGGSGK